MTDTTETVTRPAPFIEAAGTTLTERLMPLLDPAQAVDTSKFAPTVAAETALQQQARGLAGGLGSFEPFLAQAGAEATGAQQFVGPQAYQEFMSPYQQEVIDTSLAALQRERDIARQQIGTQAAQLGAFGGGRQAVQEAEFDAATALGKAQMEGQLRAQAFQQAQQQAGLDALYQNRLRQQMEPYHRLGFLSDIFQGAPSSQMQFTTGTAPGSGLSPFQQYLGYGIGGLSAISGANKLGLFG